MPLTRTPYAFARAAVVRSMPSQQSVTLVPVPRNSIAAAPVKPEMIMPRTRLLSEPAPNRRPLVEAVVPLALSSTRASPPSMATGVIMLGRAAEVTAIVVTVERNSMFAGDDAVAAAAFATV